MKICVPSKYPGYSQEIDFPIDMTSNDQLNCRSNINLAPGFSIKFNGIPILTSPQKISAPLAPHTFTSSYPSNLPKLQALYDKVIQLEKILRAHNLVQS